MSVVKDLVKTVAVSVATSAAFVALDQAVRTVVSHKLKNVLSKKEDTKENK